MKQFAILLSISLALISFTQLNAQSSDVDEAFTSVGIKDQLWYGGGFMLGFSGNSQSSSFGIGVTPMVGYKITDNFSVGPKAGINYQYIKGNAQNSSTGEVSTKAVNLTEYIAGVFARLKFLQQFFVHAEGEFRSNELVFVSQGNLFVYDPDEDKVRTARVNEFGPLAGLGYSSAMGGPWAYEISVLYRFNVPEDDLRLPFDFRVGFTYNF